MAGAGAAQLRGAEPCEMPHPALHCLIEGGLLGFACAKQTVREAAMEHETFKGGAGYLWKSQRPANPDRRADFAAAVRQNKNRHIKQATGGASRGSNMTDSTCTGPPCRQVKGREQDKPGISAPTRMATLSQFH